MKLQYENQSNKTLKHEILSSIFKCMDAQNSMLSMLTTFFDAASLALRLNSCASSSSSVPIVPNSYFFQKFFVSSYL
jgi:hypothetical protein